MLRIFVRWGLGDAHSDDPQVRRQQVPRAGTGQPWAFSPGFRCGADYFPQDFREEKDMTKSPQVLPAVTPGGRRWFTMDHLVTFGETSKAGFVYFTRFFEWQGLCRETCGYLFLADYMESLDEHHAMITSSASCELLLEVQAAETITLRMAVVWVRLHF